MCLSDLRCSIQVVKDKYIVYNLSLHMTESNCARGVRSVYTEDCKLRARAPTNYCEVSNIQCYHTPYLHITMLDQAIQCNI